MSWTCCWCIALKWFVLFRIPRPKGIRWYLSGLYVGTIVFMSANQKRKKSLGQQCWKYACILTDGATVVSCAAISVIMTVHAGLYYILRIIHSPTVTVRLNSVRTWSCGVPDSTDCIWNHSDSVSNIDWYYTPRHFSKIDWFYIPRHLRESNSRCEKARSVFVFR